MSEVSIFGRATTTQAKVDLFVAARPIFAGLVGEIRELSKKKPDATMSAGKVRLVNRVLEDLLTALADEPTRKYLETLDDDALPQMSDAVLTMVQFESACAAYEDRYCESSGMGEDHWHIEG